MRCVPQVFRLRCLTPTELLFLAPLLSAGFLIAHTADLVAQEAGKPANGTASTVTWAVESSHTTLPGTGSTFYVRVRVKAPDAAQPARQPLNLALVFDRSGSMSEQAKIGYVRQAGHLVVDNLTPQDYVAVACFNEMAQTLVPIHPVINREYLHHRIDELAAEGQTNLSGGLLEGCAQLESRLSAAGLHHVILLTDGLANRGVYDPAALVQMTKNCAARGITLTTIGVGTEYNENLLSSMAQAGNGRYVYVAKPDQIPTAFKQELGDLLSVAIQNVKLHMDLPPGIEATQVFGREEPLKVGTLDIPWGDMTSGEERRLLVKFRVVPAMQPAVNRPIELRTTLTYDDITGGRRAAADQVTTFERSANVGTTPVLDYAQLVEGVDKIALAVKSMDRTLAAEVLRIRQQYYPQWRQTANNSNDQDFVNKAYMFNHYSRELQELIDEGALHEHSTERAQLQKDLHYRRFLMEHHQHQHSH